MTSIFRHTLLAAALGLGALTATAQDFRIGFVNTDRIFRESNPAKAAQTKLEQEFSKREKELDEQGNQLKAASDKFEREAPTLPESQRANRQRQKFCTPMTAERPAPKRCAAMSTRGPSAARSCGCTAKISAPGLTESTRA